MLELAQRYKFQERGIVIPSPEELKTLLQNNDTLVNTPLFSSKGIEIKFACSVKGESIGRRWFLLTAVAGENPIGFIDVWFLPDSPLGFISTCKHSYIRRSADYDFTYSKFRDKGEDDAFYITEVERKRGIGKTLLFTAMELLKMAGATDLYVNLPPEEVEPFYEKLGGEQTMQGYKFALK